MTARILPFPARPSPIQERIDIRTSGHTYISDSPSYEIAALLIEHQMFGAIYRIDEDRS